MKYKSVIVIYSVCLILCVGMLGKLAAQTGTGLNYMPTYVNVTGGGNMPDTINGYVCDCDGTGKTDATSCLQKSLNTASGLGKPLLIPYTSGYYKINGTLQVNCSVIGIGGMPTIKQTSTAVGAVGLRLVNNMTGWIYNLHIVGTYSGSGLTDTEWSHNISIGGVNGVTIKGNLLELPKGDCVTDNAQDGDANACRNVLITNNTMLNPSRCNISTNSLTDRWAILNNYLTYYSSYVDPIDLEPWHEISWNSNIEIAYNNIQSPNPRWEDSKHFYASIIMVTAWFDQTPGENIYAHHNYGDWGAPATKVSNYKGQAASNWKNVVIHDNVEGLAPVASTDTKAPEVPTGLSAIISDKSVDLSWKAATDNVAVTAYEVFKNGVSAGITLDTSMKISGLSCATAYSLTMKARDAVMNWSEASTPLNVTTPYCPGSDSIVTFENRPTTKTQLTGNYANINFGASGWTTYAETNLNPESIVLKMNSNGVTEQTDTIIVLSGNTLKSLNIAALGNPAIRRIILSSNGNPDCAWTDMDSTLTIYHTNWKIVADTIIVKIICDSGASAVLLDNLVFGDTQQPTSPTGLASSELSFTSATLSWTSSTDNVAVAGYEVFKNGVSFETTTGTSMKINGLSCNTEYPFIVRAKDLSGNWSGLSDPFSITTSFCDIIAPEIVQNLIAGNITANSFVLFWNPTTDNDGIAGYEVYKDGIKYGSTTTETSMNITGLSQSSTYSMIVKAKDNSGNISEASLALLVTTTQCELPLEWKSVDIGVTSGQSACESAGVFTITGSGADIWGTTDQFSYTCKSLNADGVIIAKVESIQNSNPWAKSGVMIRQDLTPESKYIDCIVTPSNGISVQYRTETAGVSSVLGSLPAVTAPYWVKLERIGDVFNAYCSPDGIAWNQVGKSAIISMSANVYFGLAVTSHQAGVACTSMISNVRTSGISTEVSGKDLNSKINFYPNPFSGQTLYLEGGQDAENIALYDMTGRLVFAQKLVGNSNQVVDFGNSLENGSYIVRVSSRNGRFSRLIIVR